MDTHPNNAPLCYVLPTPDMCIKVSLHTDYSGKIYLPYLHNWTPVLIYFSNLIIIIKLSYFKKIVNVIINNIF